MKTFGFKGSSSPARRGTKSEVMIESPIEKSSFGERTTDRRVKDRVVSFLLISYQMSIAMKAIDHYVCWMGHLLAQVIFGYYCILYPVSILLFESQLKK